MHVVAVPCIPEECDRVRLEFRFRPGPRRLRVCDTVVRARLSRVAGVSSETFDSRRVSARLVTGAWWRVGGSLQTDSTRLCLVRCVRAAQPFPSRVGVEL